MASKGKLALKRRYERAASIAPFYTGGPVVVSRDGSRIACKCGGDVKLLDAASGEIVATIPADAEDITALALSPSGQELVTAGRDMMVKTWDIATQKKIRAWKSGHGNSFVQQLAYDDTGTLVAGGCSDAVVRVWDAARGFATHSLSGHGAIITCLAFGPTPRADPNKLQLFSGAEDGEVRVWALATKSCKAVLNGHDSAVTALALHLGTKTLLTGGRDRVVGVWDLDTMSSAHSLPIYDAIEGLAIVEPAADSVSQGKGAAQKKKKGKDAQMGGGGPRRLERASLEVVTAGANGQLKRWCVGTGSCTRSEESRAGAVGYVSLLSADSQAGAAHGHGHGLLVAVTIEQTLLFFRPDTLEIEKQMVGYNDEVVDIAFASAEPRVLAVCTNSDHLRLFDTTSQSCRVLHGHTNVILAVDCQAALGLLATSSKDRVVRVWDVKTGRCLAVGEGHIDAVGAVAWGQRTGDVCCSGSNDQSIKIWNTAKLARAARKALSGAAEGDDEAEVGKVSVLRGWKAHDKDINSVTLSPNEAMVASGSQDRTVKLWHLESGALALTCKGHKRGVWCVKFSPVDKVVASASADATVKLWAASDGACLKTLEGHEGSVLKVAFVSSGLQLLSTASDGLLKLWTIKTCECVGSFDHHEDKVWALAAPPGDDSMVATGGADGLIHVWSDTSGQLEDEARADTEQRLAMEQELSNALRAKDVRKAALLALRLQHPARLLLIVKDVLMSAAPEPVLKDVAAALDKEQLAQSLGYIRDWNTSGRNSGAAQALLYAILTTWPARQLEEVEGVKALVDALLPYTQRHLQRLEDCLQRSYLLDFTLHAMQTSLGGDDGAPSAAAQLASAPSPGALASDDSDAEVRSGTRRAAHGGDDDGEDEGWEGAAESDQDEEEDEGVGAGSRGRRATHGRSGDSRGRRDDKGDMDIDESASSSDELEAGEEDGGRGPDGKRRRPAAAGQPSKARKERAGAATQRHKKAKEGAAATPVVRRSKAPAAGSKTTGKKAGGASKAATSARKHDRRTEADSGGGEDGEKRLGSGKQVKTKRLSL